MKVFKILLSVALLGIALMLAGCVLVGLTGSQEGIAGHVFFTGVAIGATACFFLLCSLVAEI